MRALLGAALCCWGLLACSRDELSSAAREKPALRPTSAPVSVPAVAARTSVAATSGDEQVPSIYDLDVPLLDAAGVVRPLDTFRGHPVLVTMFYGTCPVACPLLTSDLKRLQARIPEPLRSEVRILMVSFDAARDTPTALAQLARERGLDQERWALASTGEDEARQLAGVLGIKYRKLDNGAFFHSSVIVLLDGQGRPQARVDGVGRDPGSILEALTALSI